MKKIISLVVAMLFCFTLVSAATINVPGDQPTIQDAVDAANESDTIVVNPGNYTEEILIATDNLMLEGANSGTPGASTRTSESTIVGHIKLNADNTTIDGFEFINGSDVPAGELAAIHIVGGHVGIDIQNNLFRREGTLDLDSSRGVINEFGGIEDSSVSSNKFTGWHTGVYLQNADGVMVTDNVMDGNMVGMSTDGAIDVTATGNDILNNGFEGMGVGLSITSMEVHQNNFVGNNVGLNNYVSEDDVDATENWWGDPSGPGGEGLGSGDNVSENVDFDPWLCSEAMSDDLSVNGSCEQEPESEFLCFGFSECIQQGGDHKDFSTTGRHDPTNWDMQIKNEEVPGKNESEFAWGHSQAVPFSVTYDPGTGVARYTLGGEEVVLNYLPGKAFEFIVPFVKGNEDGNDVEITSIALNGQSYGDLESQADRRGLRIPLSDENQSDGFNITGQVALIWNESGHPQEEPAFHVFAMNTHNLTIEEPEEPPACVIPEVTCDGGQITDEWSGSLDRCDTIVCSNNGDDLELLVCPKPNEGETEFFEAYQQGENPGNLEICLDGTCLGRRTGFGQVSCEAPEEPPEDNQTDGNQTNGNQTEEPVCQDLTCAGGQIIDGIDTPLERCDTIICSDNGNQLEALVCPKPDEGEKTNFEMYQQGENPGNLEICLGDNCIGIRTGFQRGDLPICEQEAPPEEPPEDNQTDGNQTDLPEGDNLVVTDMDGTWVEFMCAPEFDGLWTDWNFGDGSTLIDVPGQTANHTFEESGRYEIWCGSANSDSFVGGFLLLDLQTQG